MLGESSSFHHNKKKNTCSDMPCVWMIHIIRDIAMGTGPICWCSWCLVRTEWPLANSLARIVSNSNEVSHVSKRIRFLFVCFWEGKIGDLTCSRKNHLAILLSSHLSSSRTKWFSINKIKHRCFFLFKLQRGYFLPWVRVKCMHMATY